MADTAATGRTSWLPTVVGTVSVVALLGSIGLLATQPTAPAPTSLWFPRGLNLPLAVALVAMGWLLTVRRPANPVSWALLASGGVASLQALAAEVAIVAHHVGSDDVGAWAALGVEALWPAIVLSLLHALGRFPGDGARRATRALALLFWTSLVSVTSGELLLAGPFQNIDWYDNPLGAVPATAANTVGAAQFVPFLLFMAAVVWRFGWALRRSRGLERQQFRWVAVLSTPFLASMSAVAFTVDATDTSTFDPVVVASMAGMSLVPVGIAIAVIRYRLFDLDRLLSRTVAWVLLTGLVVGLWAAVALLPTALLGGDGSADQLLVAGATVLAAAAFNPLRLRLQDAVDQRLHRERYDAHREVERLGARLADEVDPTTVVHHVVITVQRTLSPATTAVWTPDREAER